MNSLKRKLKHFIDKKMPHFLYENFSDYIRITEYEIENHHTYLLLFMTVTVRLSKYIEKEKTYKFKKNYKKIWCKIYNRSDFNKLYHIIDAVCLAIKNEKFQPSYFDEFTNTYKKRNLTYRGRSCFKQVKKYITDL